MAGPSGGACNRDVFSVTGQDSNSLVPVLCGDNGAQHVYLEVGERPGPFQLRVVTSSSAPHRWRVLVSQRRAAAARRAPPHCLQYHTGRTGTIASFNYRAQGAAAGYTNNLNYMICIRKEAGFCSITYSTDEFGTMPEAEEFSIVNFQASNSTSDPGGERPTVPEDQAGVGPTQCPHDFLVLGVDRLCGSRLNDGAASSTLTDNADVTDSSAGQFTVKFVTDARRTGRGFRLFYRQNPCTARQV